MLTVMIVGLMGSTVMIGSHRRAKEGRSIYGYREYCYTFMDYLSLLP